MKIVFYRALLKRAMNISPCERILYSFLVSKSILRLDDIYDNEGFSLNKEELEIQLRTNGNAINICELNHSKIARELNMTRKTIIEGMKTLKKLGYISDKRICVDEELIKRGYFVLEHVDVLKGDLLIFYSYLRDKSSDYGYCIDTCKEKLAIQVGKTKTAVTKLLNKLYAVGLAQRLNNDKLLIK